MTHTKNAAFEAVLNSYHRCETAGGLFDTFYDVFFAKSPEIPPKFVQTDMERQKQDVMASVLMALRLAGGDAVARKYVSELAESHSRGRHNIKPELYALWLDALCESIKQHDPQYTPELEQQWREAMRPAIELMMAAY
ncbi:MAG: globin [Planctomycetota bacterium]|nr:MAG: globin [Planctomycetota bacterium]